MESGTFTGLKALMVILALRATQVCDVQFPVAL